MPMIPPKKLAAFAEKKDKNGGFPPAFAKKGKMGYGGKNGKPGHEEEHEHGPGGEDIDIDAAAEEVKGDHKTMEWAKGYDPEADGNPPEWVANEDIWEKAKGLVDPEGEGAEYDEPWSVVAAVYSKLGGQKKGGKGNPFAKKHDEDEDHDDHDQQDHDEE